MSSLNPATAGYLLFYGLNSCSEREKEREGDACKDITALSSLSLCICK